jgi:hypothetical protein
MVRGQETVRSDFAINRGKHVQPTSELENLSRANPPGKLPPHIQGIDVPRKEQARLEERLIPNNPEKLLKLHCINMPLLAI